MSKIPQNERANYVRAVLRQGGGGTMGVQLFVPAAWAAAVAIELGFDTCKLGGVIELPADPKATIVLLVPFCQISKIEPVEVRDEVKARIGADPPKQLLTEAPALAKK